MATVDTTSASLETGQAAAAAAAADQKLRTGFGRDPFGAVVDAGALGRSQSASQHLLQESSALGAGLLEKLAARCCCCCSG